MNHPPVRGHLRAIRVLLLYIGALALLAVVMATGTWWLDAAFVGLVFALLLALSLRTLFAKWHSLDANDITKHGPLAAYPESWRRWLLDEDREGKTRT